MSNDRSPREVCSITIGINGLISGWLLAAGGPQFRLGLGLFLVRGPDSLTRLRLLRRDALHLGRDAVQSTGQADRFALRLVDAGLLRLVDHAVCVLEAIPEGRFDVFVAHLD